MTLSLVCLLYTNTYNTYIKTQFNELNCESEMYHDYFHHGP